MEGLRAILAVLACALPFAVAAQEPDQEPDPTDRDPARVTLDVEALKAEIQEILDENRIPGASVALVEKDRTIWAGGVGKADVAAGIEVTADHLFRIGSISKSFTALAMLHAVEGGLLDLDTPVRELAPEVAFTNPWRNTHPVTVATVMEHTAGFDDIHFREYAKVDDPGMTLAEGLAYNPGSRVSRWPPGTHMSYSNSGPSIAAYVVETITGKTFEEYVREHVFDPLGMETSTFHFPRDANLPAKGYEADGASEARYDHIIVRPSGAMNSSSREMARYLRMMINRGTLDGVRLLAPETITRMETPTTTLAARAGFTYGYGLGNFTSIVNGHLFHGHNGGITGFASTSAYSSDLGVGFFVSINKPGSAIRDIAALVGERLTAGFEKPQGAVAALSDEELRTLTGWYQGVTPRQQLAHVLSRFFLIERVTLEAGRLLLAPLGGEGRELVPVTAASFRYGNEPVARVFAVVDDEGDPILQGGAGRQQQEGRRRLAALPVRGRGDHPVAADLGPALRARVGARQGPGRHAGDPAPDAALPAAGRTLHHRLVRPAVRSDLRRGPGSRHPLRGIAHHLPRLARVRGAHGAEPPCHVPLLRRQDQPPRPAARPAREPGVHRHPGLSLEQRIDRAQDVGLLMRTTLQPKRPSRSARQPAQSTRDACRSNAAGLLPRAVQDRVAGRRHTRITPAAPTGPRDERLS